MSENVVALVNNRPDEQAQAVIERLESWLQMARDGKLLSVAAAFTEPGGWVGQGWTESENTTLLLGAVEILRGRMASALIESSKDEQ